MGYCEMHWNVGRKNKLTRCVTVLFALLVTASNSCSQTSERDSKGDELGRYVFDVFEENYAWGYILRGFYVDRDGNVLSYDHSDDRWVPTQSRSGRLSEADLADKFYNAKKMLTVHARTVREKAQKILPASHGAISKFSASRDRGRYAYVAYEYDPDRRNYRVVVLAADGDWVETNSAPAAQELVAWLKEVKEKLSEVQLQQQ